MQKIKTSSIVLEILNATSHGIGTVLSIIAIIFLIKKGVSLNSAKIITIYMVYGLSIFLLFLSSTLYHSFVFSKYAIFFQKIDHITIYLLIAGSYTPYLLLTIGGTLGTVFLIMIWSLAAFGIIFEIMTLDKYPKISLLLYLVSGWFIILIIRPLINSLDFRGLLLLFLGGISYSIGTIFYCLKKLEWLHLIWHLFVIAGAGFMFCSILFYV